MSKFSDFFKELNIGKDMVEKPGEGTHSPKWDRCVEEVKNSGKGKNAYAICTAAIGSGLSKDMNDDDFAGKIKMYMQKLGISEAGPIPNTLLSRQDLERENQTTIAARMEMTDQVSLKAREDLWIWRQGDNVGGEEVQWAGEEAQKTQDIGNFAVWYYDKSGARKCAVFGNSRDAIAYANIVDSMGYKAVKILKGQIEKQDEELENIAEQAEEVETKKEAKDLVSRIKNIQVKRQKTVLSMRDANKSFKDIWSNKNNNIK